MPYGRKPTHMKNNIEVSIVIVSYNTRQILSECIESIEKNIGNISYEVIVVDNASTDDTVAYLKKSSFKNLKVIANTENEGFSKANNRGVSHAIGKYILFLNSDTVVYETTIEGMIAFMDEHKSVGAATCYLVMPNGKLDDASHRGFPTPWNSFAHFSGIAKLFPKSRLFGGYNLGYKNLSKPHEIDALAGAFMLVRREAGEAVGWWDEDYFWYGEDIDFCYRLKQKKWKIYFVPQYKILHYKGVSGGIKKGSQKITKASKETKRKATHARFDAMRIFYQKHYTHKYPKVVTSLVLSGIGLKEYATKKMQRI